MADSMLTTSDNPFDPFDNYDEWYTWDVQHGYNTCSYLARIVVSSDGLGEEDENQSIEDAMDEIVRINVTGNYKKITR